MSKHKEAPKKISGRKLAANQENARKSTGPHNCNLTRYNAAKHRLLARGITELDDDCGLSQLSAQLEAEFNPIGELEIALVQRIAFCIVRLHRAALIEAEFITGKLHPPVIKTVYPEGSSMSGLLESLGETVVVDTGRPARLSVADVESLQKFQRYETSIENKFYRALTQLERLQRLRGGEKIPAPASLDVNVHREGDDVASFGNSPHA